MGICYNGASVNSCYCAYSSERRCRLSITRAKIVIIAADTSVPPNNKIVSYISYSFLDGELPFSPFFFSLIPRKRPVIHSTVAAVNPPIISISCDTPPRKIPPRKRAPNTSLPKSCNSFPTSSFSDVCFFCLFIFIG